MGILKNTFNRFSVIPDIVFSDPETGEEMAANMNAAPQNQNTTLSIPASFSGLGSGR